MSAEIIDLAQVRRVLRPEQPKPEARPVNVLWSHMGSDWPLIDYRHLANTPGLPPKP